MIHACKVSAETSMNKNVDLISRLPLLAELPPFSLISLTLVKTRKTSPERQSLPSLSPTCLEKLVVTTLLSVNESLVGI
jgi:hypothetical protein